MIEIVPKPIEQEDKNADSSKSDTSWRESIVSCF